MPEVKPRLSWDWDDFVVHTDTPVRKRIEAKLGEELIYLNNARDLSVRYGKLPNGMKWDSEIYEYLRGPAIENPDTLPGVEEALKKAATVFENHITTARPSDLREATEDQARALNIDSYFEDIHFATTVNGDPLAAEKGRLVVDIVRAEDHGDDANKSVNSVQKHGGQGYLLKAEHHVWNGPGNEYEELDEGVIVVSSLSEFVEQAIARHEQRQRQLYEGRL